MIRNSLCVRARLQSCRRGAEKNGLQPLRDLNQTDQRIFEIHPNDFCCDPLPWTVSHARKMQLRKVADRKTRRQTGKPGGRPENPEGGGGFNPLKTKQIDKAFRPGNAVANLQIAKRDQPMISQLPQTLQSLQFRLTRIPQPRPHFGQFCVVVTRVRNQLPCSRRHLFQKGTHSS